jgi:hypothetical protein
VSTTIERPIFFENQILGAADLTATVENSRAQEARHNRYLHSPGIAAGLELTKLPDKDKGDPFIKITLSAGLAIDGTGREIIVPQAEPLSESKFSQLQITGGAGKDDWFPVFLAGEDQKTAQAPFSTGVCMGGTAASRVGEGYQISFGRPGDERKLDEQSAGQISDGPGKGGWLILLGFVKWDKTVNAFSGLKPDGRKYAGVQADEVAARGGSLILRTQTRAQANKPAVILDETGDGLLQFGALDSQGKLKPVFSVNAKGDITTEGKISSAVAPGSVQIQSGVVMDGLLLPLPPGIDPDDIASGKLTLHTYLTPQTTLDRVPDPTKQWGVVPLECKVDSDRRIICRLRWFTLGAAPTITELAGFCEYVALVSVPAASGNTP